MISRNTLPAVAVFLGTAVLLADGNIGIGGDPAALLRRVSELLAPQGRNDHHLRQQYDGRHEPQPKILHDDEQQADRGDEDEIGQQVLEREDVTGDRLGDGDLLMGNTALRSEEHTSELRHT